MPRYVLLGVTVDISEEKASRIGGIEPLEAPAPKRRRTTKKTEPTSEDD